MSSSTLIRRLCYPIPLPPVNVGPHLSHHHDLLLIVPLRVLALSEALRFALLPHIRAALPPFVSHPPTLVTWELNVYTNMIAITSSARCATLPPPPCLLQPPLQPRHAHVAATLPPLHDMSASLAPVWPSQAQIQTTPFDVWAPHVMHTTQTLDPLLLLLTCGLYMSVSTSHEAGLRLAIPITWTWSIVNHRIFVDMVHRPRSHSSVFFLIILIPKSHRF